MVLGQEGGTTPHTGDIDVVISQNDFIVTDHLTGPLGCPGGSLAFNHPQGGVSLNPAGGTYEAIVSNNLFDQVMHAAGGFGQLTLGLNGGNVEAIVRGNEFRLPWDAAVQVRAEGASSAAVLFENNSYTDGMVGSAADDVGFSTPSPFQGFLVNVRDSGQLDLTIRNEDLPVHDNANSPTKQAPASRGTEPGRKSIEPIRGELHSAVGLRLYSIQRNLQPLSWRFSHWTAGHLHHRESRNRKLPDSS